jgi:uncharacterized protein (TIGR03437 family)
MRIYTLALPLVFAGVALAQAPVVATGGVLNGASFTKGQAVTPGSLVSIFGTNLASSVAEADTIPLSNSLGGVTVEFVNGPKSVPAPMLFVGSQLNVQIPWEIVPAGTTANINVIVTNSAGSSSPVQVAIGQYSPGVFSSNGLAIAINSDGTLAWPTGAVPGLTTHPAKIGDVVEILATGLGAVASPPADGANSIDQLRTNLVQPQVMIGGVTAQVGFAGLSPQFVGVNQINITVPSVAAGSALPLQLVLGGITTPSNITMAVSQ